MKNLGQLREIRPNLNLGFFWLQYCALRGVRVKDETKAAECRHEGALNTERGCWGPVRGRLIFSNQFYARGGNFPAEVSFSCQAHKNQDFHDPDLYRCEVCECLFRRSSMWSNLICCTCFDQELLFDKNNWVSLNARSIQQFDFSDVVRPSPKRQLVCVCVCVGVCYVFRPSPQQF